jgi:hypothetical protein
MARWVHLEQVIGPFGDIGVELHFVLSGIFNHAFVR